MLELYSLIVMVVALLLIPFVFVATWEFGHWLGRRLGNDL